MKTLITALCASLISLSAVADHSVAGNAMTYSAPISSEVEINEAHADLRRHVGGEILVVPSKKMIVLTQAPCTGICTMEVKEPKIFTLLETKKDENGVVTYLAREVPNANLPADQALPILTVTDYSRAENLATIYMADTVIRYSSNVVIKGAKPKNAISTLIAMRLETIR